MPLLNASLIDSVWFIKIIGTLETNVEITDDCQNKIASEQSSTEDRFMEKVEVSAKVLLFKLSKKKTYFFKESVFFSIHTIYISSKRIPSVSGGQTFTYFI